MRHHKKRGLSFLARGLVILGLLLTTLVVSGALWYLYPGLRSIIAGITAALAAFLAPIPGIVSPETRGKWLFVIGVSAVIGMGTWYNSDELQRGQNRLAREAVHLKQRLSMQQQFFQNSVNNLSAKEKSKFLLASARRLKELYPQPQVEPITDLASVINQIDQENGHALYFAGEEYRSLAAQTNMRGSFQQYLAAADHHPEALTGDYHACYERPAGYCAERVALVNHMMARDYYHEALKYAGERKAETLRTALRYERHGLQLWRFNRDGSFESSCELLQEIGKDMQLLGKPTREVDSALEWYRQRYGPC